ncbi:MAG: hypothetical protein HY067_13720 [Betaproteobacteria bacterium]|nr:hypothetical protein [Betaproteobacteria bacterium]
MQIKSIPVAAVAFAFLLAGGAAFAVEQDNSKSAKAEEMSAAKTTVLVRNTRPQVDRHKDARTCLKAGSNEAIIRCTRKYR